MNRIIGFGLSLFFLLLGDSWAQGRARDLEKVHDPSMMVFEEGVGRFLSTGFGVSVMAEGDDGRWRQVGSIFSEGNFPAWHEEKVPGNRRHLWAPDVIRLGEDFAVYYSVSTFGKNQSAIGLAVGKTLDPKASDWGWQDRGVVVESRPGDRLNAIDPALFRDPKDERLWMTYGSFWEGIFLVELDGKSGLRKEGAGEIHLAKGPEIEAPYLHRQGDWYYLFVNWGKCCRGIESTYEIRVGRSKKITGPYLDHDGHDLRLGGGKLVLASEGDFIGPGHAFIYQKDNKEWLGHHYYDRRLNGKSRFRALPVTWDQDKWPVALRAK